MHPKPRPRKTALSVAIDAFEIFPRQPTKYSFKMKPRLEVRCCYYLLLPRGCACCTNCKSKNDNPCWGGEVARWAERVPRLSGRLPVSAAANRAEYAGADTQRAVKRSDKMSRCGPLTGVEPNADQRCDRNYPKNAVDEDEYRREVCGPHRAPAAVAQDIGAARRPPRNRRH